MKLNELTQAEKRVILEKGTEMPFVGEYVNNKDTGVYVCRQCNAPLYDSAGTSAMYSKASTLLTKTSATA